MNLISLIIGSFIGYIYGLFFAAQQRRAFSLTSRDPRRQAISIIIFTLTRFTFFAISIFYILHSPSINPILVITSFIILFWYSAISKRMRSREEC